MGERPLVFEMIWGMCRHLDLISVIWKKKTLRILKLTFLEFFPVPIFRLVLGIKPQHFSDLIEQMLLVMFRFCPCVV